MHNVFRVVGGLLLAPLIVWCFYPGFVELYQTYSSFWLYENTVAAAVVVLLYAIFSWKFGLNKKSEDKDFPGLLICMLLLSACMGLILNNFLGGFQIILPILTYLAIYSWLGFWLTPVFWKRSIFIVVLLILTLPILERLQKFIGFPLRLLTAKIVSFLLQLAGAGTISNATVIMTENYATTVDLPCSGVKSIYFGGIILFVIGFLQELTVSIKLIILSILFFALLVFFNIWRVFGLVYVYGVLNLIEIGDTIHIFLGVFGFIVSCVCLWYGSEYIKNTKDRNEKKFAENTRLPMIRGISRWFNRSNTILVCVSLVLITSLLTKTTSLSISSQAEFTHESATFVFPSAVLSQIPFSEKEETLFLHTDVTFAGKYSLHWQNKDISLLLVTSNSARSHHDPELCLQGLGYRLIGQETITLGDDHIQQITIQTAKQHDSVQADVYYWYVNKDKTITDYSQRVWEQFRQPNQEWVLVELAVLDSQKLTQEELTKLFMELTAAVRVQLL
jgi:exosortase O